jgi:hypothetical protein
MSRSKHSPSRTSSDPRLKEIVTGLGIGVSTSSRPEPQIRLAHAATASPHFSSNRDSYRSSTSTSIHVVSRTKPGQLSDSYHRSVAIMVTFPSRNSIFALQQGRQEELSPL